MKKILILIMLLFVQLKSYGLVISKKSPATKNRILIELGEDYKINKISDKLWIENQKIVKAEMLQSTVVLKPQSVGNSKIRIDGQIKTVSVIPAGYKFSYTTWSGLSYQFPNIQVGFCENTICLNGSLQTMIEFEKLIRLMQENNAALFLNLQIKTELRKKIELWYTRFFRENSLTPLKIVFGQTWKVFLPKKEDFQTERDILQRAGLNVLESKQKLEILDNVRVKIQITEVKKELTRKWGLQWPNEYSATVINSAANPLDPFDLKIRASEKNGDMKILASPNLICRSGKSAEFFAGGEFPIVTNIDKYKTNVIWKKYGIELKIKPFIDSVGQMSIELETEISSIDKSKEMNGIPAIHTHKVMSHFDLIKSKTIALSGLIKNESGKVKEGVPYLSQIPILGQLFASEDFLDNQTELVIFVTPELMEP